MRDRLAEKKPRSVVVEMKHARLVGKMERALTGLVIATIFVVASLPAEGALWPTLLGLLTFAAFLRSVQREPKPAHRTLLQLTLPFAFVGCAFYFGYDFTVHKYGGLVLSLVGIATYASLRSQNFSAKQQIAFSVVTIFIESIWLSNGATQALYELRTAGGLTTLQNECASALAKLPLTLAWIATIGTTELFESSNVDRADAQRNKRDTVLTRWLFAGSFAAAIVLGVTQWRDWQVQTACF